jgi:hypothetical protein
LARPGWVTAMEAVKNAIAIANWNLLRAVTDGKLFQT